MGALLDYYEGAYGPTIRFDSNSLDDMEELKAVLGRLAASEAREVALHHLGCLSVCNLEALILSLVEVEPEVALRRVGRRRFLWVNSREGWARSCGLIDGLIQANKPGHQYLTNEGIDDALVEVCLLERVDRSRGAMSP